MNMHNYSCNAYIHIIIVLPSDPIEQCLRRIEVSLDIHKTNRDNFEQELARKETGAILLVGNMKESNAWFFGEIDCQYN